MESYIDVDEDANSGFNDSQNLGTENDFSSVPQSPSKILTVSRPASVAAAVTRGNFVQPVAEKEEVTYRQALTVLATIANHNADPATMKNLVNPDRQAASKSHVNQWIGILKKCARVQEVNKRFFLAMRRSYGTRSDPCGKPDRQRQIKRGRPSQRLLAISVLRYSVGYGQGSTRERSLHQAAERIRECHEGRIRPNPLHLLPVMIHGQVGNSFSGCFIQCVPVNSWRWSWLRSFEYG